ncbi:hypothetical protein J2S10_003734 [Neobacillus ginsengisoli]|uniref:Transposase n=1 Tax=Neobacillus ginsengisoli TaxID=904295 RepID=A0ABT9XYA9_9BACI|nr:hypothetical protein [Neobacillus ginsengisoli]
MNFYKEDLQFQALLKELLDPTCAKSVRRLVYFD